MSETFAAILATSPATVITLEDCTADFVDMNSMQKLPNQVQLIESDLPLREAENLEGLQGNYLFRYVILRLETNIKHSLFRSLD